MNKCGQFCVKKIFLHYRDILIFAFGYFILPHPVQTNNAHITDTTESENNTAFATLLLRGW